MVEGLASDRSDREDCADDYGHSRPDNMLALNAAIEAARAGGHGTRFCGGGG